MLARTGLAAGILETIQVSRNAISIIVNGEKVDKDNFVYNGTAYVPLRAVAEMFGFNVDWNQDTNTADINGNVSTVTSADRKAITSPQQLNPYNPQINIQDLGINAKQDDNDTYGFPDLRQ